MKVPSISLLLLSVVLLDVAKYSDAAIRNCNVQVKGNKKNNTLKHASQLAPYQNDTVITLIPDGDQAIGVAGLKVIACGKMFAPDIHVHYADNKLKVSRVADAFQEQAIDLKVIGYIVGMSPGARTLPNDP